jgi:hypothetical protein
MRNAMTDRINARLPGALGGALLALLCAGAAQAQTAGGDGAPAPSDAPRPGDVVRVKIWQEPDFRATSPWTARASSCCPGWGRGM